MSAIAFCAELATPSQSGTSSVMVASMRCFRVVSGASAPGAVLLVASAAPCNGTAGDASVP